MAFWSKIFNIFGGDKAESVDYYEEGLALAQEGKFHDALTSFRLALRYSPGDPVILQQIAIAYTRIGMTEDAIKMYRHVLDRTPEAPGAHYGLAFLLIHRGEQSEAVKHLEAFLSRTPDGVDAKDHIEHARATLETLKSQGGASNGVGDGQVASDVSK